MNKKIEHLKLIQNIISRMANNSFYLKGWTITLVSAFIALLVSSKNYKYIIAALIPLFVFWLLDGFFLREESLYRMLYDNVRLKAGDDSDFSMDIKPFLKDVDGLIRTCFSKTLITFYAGILTVIISILFAA